MVFRRSEHTEIVYIDFFNPSSIWQKKQELCLTTALVGKLIPCVSLTLIHGTSRAD